MTTKTEAIVAAIVSTLTTAGIRTRTDTANPYSFEDVPAIVVDIGNENPQGVVGGSGGMIYWDLEVTLWILGAGDSPKLAPETTRATAHAALYANRTLGGVVVDVNVGTVKRHIDPDNPAAGITEATYTVKYRVTGQKHGISPVA